MEENNTEDNFKELQLPKNSREARLMKALSPKLDETQNRIIVDFDKFKSELDDVINKEAPKIETFSLRSEFHGIEVSMGSQTEPVAFLQASAQDSFNFLLDKRESKIPLGVN